jgi:tetratricopeptide (TPR) repeat protein
LIKYFYDWDMAGGNADLERAIALDPDNATAHQLYGKNLPGIHEFDRALTELELARKLEPYSTGINKDIGETLFYARRYDEAIAQFWKTLEVEPGSPPVYFWLVRSYEMAGMHDRAIEVLFERLALPGAKSDGGALAADEVDSLREIYRVEGWEAFWRRRLEMIKDAAANQYVEPYRLTEIYMRLGDYDAAFASLETAFRQRSSWIATIDIDPLLDPLRDDPRLTDLARRAGLR